MLIPGARTRYLAEIAEQGRHINARIETLCEAANRAQHVYEALKGLPDNDLPEVLSPYAQSALTVGGDRSLATREF